MAFAALVSLAQTIDVILNYHQDLISSLVENELISIYNSVSDILQAELDEDFPEKANSLKGRKEAAHAAEDVIEFVLSIKIHESFPALSEFKLTDENEREWCSCAGNPELTEHQTWKEYRQVGYSIYDLYKVTDEIEAFTENMMKIKNSITDKDVGLSDSTAAASSSTVAPAMLKIKNSITDRDMGLGDSTAASSSTVVPAHKDVMVGRDNDLLEIKSRLCGESSKLQVIPIVGMGGIGKTTFARNVYDDPLIMEYFQIREWVTVSKDYNVEEVISDLLVSMKVLDKKDESREAHHVYKNLKSRKYLIVLDDLWSTKAWDDLKMMFPDDCNGSRIMITTRLSDVATYPDSYSPVHEMHLMDVGQSWNLLRQRVFKQDHCPVELEDVGKIIAKDVKSAISANDEQLDKILSLSYTSLLHHLRSCFLYMGGFPEDYKMSASKLIRLWVAEGFLIPNGYNKSFEETAEDYLEDLVKRSLVLVTKRKNQICQHA